MFERLYTTKMSADKKSLQKRFSKIRSHNGKFSKVMAMLMASIVAVTMLCATIVMAAFDGLETTNGIFVLNEQSHGIDIVHIQNNLAVHTDSYYIPLREVFELLGYQVTYDVDKSKYADLMGRHTFPVYDYVDMITLEDGTVMTYNADEWKRQFVKNEIDQYIYGQTERTNAQMPIIEMEKYGETEYCQIGSKNYSKGYAPAPILISGKTYIPLRAVAYYVGSENVKWDDRKHDTYFEGTFTFDEENMTVTISSHFLPAAHSR